jgi:alpha-glucosidase (family GH31 glycosyl hydrolase)
MDGDFMDLTLKDIGFSVAPKAPEASMVQGDKYRFTILTPQLIRLEYDETGRFEDRATQIVIDRNFPLVEYRVKNDDNGLEIITENLHLVYDKKKFSKNGLSIQVVGNLSQYRSIWRFGEEAVNLKGTTRTLDESNGAVPLEDGLLSRNGFSILDDSRSFIIGDDGWISPRSGECIDIYFFGYGREYLNCLRDFFKLCGETPMLPRYALGNWWSRFYPYSETSYKALIEKFEKEEIPFSVAVLDMDWHITDVDPKYGSGWTGYTWNKNLFPDPEGFIGWLNNKGLKVTLNVHPADGVRAYEEMYPEMAKELGVDLDNEDKIHFDMTDPEFVKAYFKHLHHPNEDIGVAFWWIDWQQGSSSKIEGLDPLWLLNHFHFIDNGRNGKRPLILSRYAGIGSHRYPIGFSGDTFATWETLDFQPYFTATASNAGYGWWSHDIGGHMHGVKDDEMAARWIQFGVFSPIMRIHSSYNPFNVKEPWQYNLIVENTMKRFLRLRHQLIPYIYTMNRRFNKEGKPLIQPMYYRHPEADESYEVPNEYYFGDLIVCPITKPMDQKLKMGTFKAWLPEGIYFDFFTGWVYRGGRKIDLFRDISTIPVLAAAGSVIPMASEAYTGNSTDNPTDLEIRVFAGANGSFCLYEDNSCNSIGNILLETQTKIEFKWGERSEFIIRGFMGDNGVIPVKRNYSIRFTGFEDTDAVTVVQQGQRIPFTKDYIKETNTIELNIRSAYTSYDLEITLAASGEIATNDIKGKAFEILNKAGIEFDLKSEIYKTIERYNDKTRLLGALQALGLESNLLASMFELITA